MSSKANPLTRGKKQKALALLQRNQPAEAIPLLEQACRADRRDAEAWFMLAAAHQKLGAFAPATEAYRQSITLRPDNAEAHYYLGNTCMALGDAPGAIDAFRHAIRLRPNYLEAHINLGALLELQKNHAAAESCYREALRLEPRNAERHYNLGNALQSQERFEEAVAAYRQSLSLRPAHADTYNNLGNALAHLERHQEAVECYEQALAIKRDLDEAWNNMGNALLSLRRIDDAMRCYRHALALRPRYAKALSNLGNAHRARGEWDEAIACHRRALEVDPDDADAHFNLAVLCLLRGDFREGWNEYQWLWRREGTGRRPLVPSAWEGSDLCGKPVFLHAEQGLGDELFFLRFASLLKARGAGRLTYRPKPKLASLLSRVSVIDRLAAPDETPAADEMVFSVGDLPRLLGHSSAKETPSPLSLEPSPKSLDAVRRHLALLGPAPYFGVTWRGGKRGDEKVLYKEIPLDVLAQTLVPVSGTVLVLQRLPAAGEIDQFATALGRPVHDLSALNDDLESMLALLALLDDYVGVSNTNMHLRAAVGKTARVLVPAPPEWRWMAEGKESPWFPGFSVYRQGYDGSWEGAFDMLAADLQQAFGR
ncbi:MAG: tetratricopeptide repeat protein [Gammaproteobacteria bacterium]|nr:MAG: tetratricopeptide repeat protein [Gammaproteobacteria bacterium]